jgi:hypothetical protein
MKDELSNQVHWANLKKLGENGKKATMILVMIKKATLVLKNT